MSQRKEVPNPSLRRSGCRQRKVRLWIVVAADHACFAAACLLHVALHDANHGGAFYVPRSLDELVNLVNWLPAPTVTSVLVVCGLVRWTSALQVYAPGMGRRIAARGRNPAALQNEWLVFVLADHPEPVFRLLDGLAAGDVAVGRVWADHDDAEHWGLRFCLYLYFKGKASPKRPIRAASCTTTSWAPS